MAAFLLLLYAVAWPWEIYQRMPLLGGTLTKWAGVGLIGVAVCAWIRDRRWTPTGVEWPIALFAAAVALSTFFAEDRGLVLGHVIRLATYAPLFFAVAALTMRIGGASWLFGSFAVSSAGVALLMYLCQAGWLAPAFIGSTRHLGARISDELREGALMRMSATAPDLNQGILCVLLAFAAAVATAARSEDRKRKFYAGALAVVLLPAVLISLSRSAILLAAAVVVAVLPIMIKKHQIRRAVVGGIALVLAAGAIYLTPYGDAFARRAREGVSTSEASFATRRYGIETALAIAPKHWWRGVGLEASDAAIQAVADPARLQGRALHSAPLRYLLELGIVGLAAYLWFWIALCRRLRRSARNPQGLAQWEAYAGLAVALSLFAMLAVQPFTELSLYPWLFGVLVAVTSTTVASSPPTKGRILGYAATLAAAAVTALIVVPNVFAYQTTVRRATDCVRLIDEAIKHEEHGEWAEAITRYGEASRAAGTMSTGSSRRPGYWAEASDVADAVFVARALGIERRTRDLRSIANFGLGRAALAAGDPQRAIAALETVVFAGIPESNYVLGDSLWYLGEFGEAISHYASAFESGARQSLRIQARLTALDGTGDLDARLESASLLAKLGRWERSVEIYTAVLSDDAENAEALYGMGINAEIERDVSAATEFYERAVQSLPNHRSAAKRLEALGAIAAADP